jgi:hypothetical protein
MNVLEDGSISATLSISLPARGRSILGYECASLVCDLLPNLVSNTLLAAAHDESELTAFVNCIEDQDCLRKYIYESNGTLFSVGRRLLSKL